MSTAPYTAFGKTRMVEVEVYQDGKPMLDADQWDKTIWIERGEDWYALDSPQLRGKRVRIVTRQAWLRAGGGA